MATLSISLSGSSVVNGTKSYTVSDADITSLLAWAQSAFSQQLPLPPATPTNQQILLAWVQSWVNGTKMAVQQFQTPPAVVPPQITIS